MTCWVTGRAVNVPLGRLPCGVGREAFHGPGVRPQSPGEPVPGDHELHQRFCFSLPPRGGTGGEEGGVLTLPVEGRTRGVGYSPRPRRLCLIKPGGEGPGQVLSPEGGHIKRIYSWSLASPPAWKPEGTFLGQSL